MNPLRRIGRRKPARARGDYAVDQEAGSDGIVGAFRFQQDRRTIVYVPILDSGLVQIDPLQSRAKTPMLLPGKKRVLFHI